jgi:hypothetical protein
MAKKGGRKGGQKRAPARAARAPVFESGEKLLNLPVRTGALSLGSSGQATYTVVWQQEGVPDHLRAVGQRHKMSVLGADNKIIHGTAVEPVRTFTTKEDDDTVVVTLIGLPGTSVRWTIGSTLYYKDI